MKLLVHLAVIAAVLLYTVSAKPTTNDDDYDPSIVADDPASSDDYDGDDLDDTEDDDKELEAPEILSVSQNLIPKIGEDVYLYCDAINADFFTTMWKHNDDIIFQDKLLLLSKMADKFQQFENRTLVIKNFQKGDEGVYNCTILSQLNNPAVMHHVSLSTPPSITLLQTKNGKNDFKLGDEFTLKCEASGSPPPKITWSLKGQRFDITGSELTISEAKHSDGGLYQCLADNQVGNPAHSTINIQIYQRPVVQVDRFTTTGNNGSFDVEIVCHVHAVPEVAKVEWRLNDNMLTSNIHHKIRTKNQKHTVTIYDAKEDDFGDYTCVAKNDMGSSNKSIHVSNKPGKPKFVHGDHKHGHKSVTLVWKLESMSPINKYELSYRNTEVNDWVTIHPEVTESDGNMYNLNYTLEHIANGKYEAKSRAKNNYGWGEYSDTTPFNGINHPEHKLHHHKTEHKDNDQETVINTDEALKSTSRDAGAAILPSLALLVATILTIFSLRN